MQPYIFSSSSRPRTQTSMRLIVWVSKPAAEETGSRRRVRSELAPRARRKRHQKLAAAITPGAPPPAIAVNSSTSRSHSLHWIVASSNPSEVWATTTRLARENRHRTLDTEDCQSAVPGAAVPASWRRQQESPCPLFRSVKITSGLS